jgi:hypothetical protein
LRDRKPHAPKSLSNRIHIVQLTPSSAAPFLYFPFPVDWERLFHLIFLAPRSSLSLSLFVSDSWQGENEKEEKNTCKLDDIERKKSSLGVICIYIYMKTQGEIQGKNVVDIVFGGKKKNNVVY